MVRKALVLTSEECMYELSLNYAIPNHYQTSQNGALPIMSSYEIKIRHVVRNMLADDINRTHDYSTDEKYPIDARYISMCGNMKKGTKRR